MRLRCDTRFAQVWVVVGSHALTAIFHIELSDQGFGQARQVAYARWSSTPAAGCVCCAWARRDSVRPRSRGGSRQLPSGSQAQARVRMGHEAFLALNLTQDGIAGASDYIRKAQALETASLPFLSLSGWVRYFTARTTIPKRSCRASSRPQRRPLCRGYFSPRVAHSRKRGGSPASARRPHVPAPTIILSRAGLRPNRRCTLCGCGSRTPRKLRIARIRRRLRSGSDPPGSGAARTGARLARTRDGRPLADAKLPQRGAGAGSATQRAAFPRSETASRTALTRADLAAASDGKDRTVQRISERFINAQRRVTAGAGIFPTTSRLSRRAMQGGLDDENVKVIVGSADTLCSR